MAAKAVDGIPDSAKSVVASIRAGFARFARARSEKKARIGFPRGPGRKTPRTALRRGPVKGRARAGYPARQGVPGDPPVPVR
ncbi:hypothetical protein GmRootV15_19810 [Variovorax sp. V15]